MKKPRFYTAKWRMLFPVTGSLAFLFLFLIATVVYPGGSQAGLSAKGFSWMHNYWCNLLNEKALNGAANTARPFAYLGMAVLLVAIMDFFLLAAKGLLESQRAKNTLLFSGAVSLLLLPFLPTGFHDAVINTSGFFGLVAMMVIFIGLYKKDWYILFAFGLFNLALIALNNYLYYSASFYFLPLVQKITIASFLLWVCMITVEICRRQAET